MERFQRRAEAALGRWLGPAGAGASGLVLAGIIATVALGEDRPDLERSVFAAGLSIPAGATNSTACLYAPAATDLELVSVWFSRGGGTINALVGTGSNFFPAQGTLGNVERASVREADGFPPLALEWGYSASLAGAGIMLELEAPANETHYARMLEGAFLRAGNVLCVQNATPAQQMRVGVAWRFLETETR